jgi:hypothetical protein
MPPRLYDVLGTMEVGDQRYRVQQLPAHLADMADRERLRDLLTRFDFLQAKVVLLGPEALICSSRAGTEPPRTVVRRRCSSCSSDL